MATQVNPREPDPTIFFYNILGQPGPTLQLPYPRTPRVTLPLTHWHTLSRATREDSLRMINPRKILIFTIALLLIESLSLSSSPLPSEHAPPGGLASGALVELDSNRMSQTDVFQQTTISPTEMFS